MRVVKVGGSLLDWSPLAEKLKAWLADQPPDASVLLAGGGRLADQVRKAQKEQGFDDETAHWMCCDVLAETARRLAAIVSASLVDSLQSIAAARAGNTSLVVFEPRTFLRDVEPFAPPAPLPHDWSATSDSIAARLAEVLEADELVLLKSADPPAFNLEQLMAIDYVDPWFAQAAARIRRISIVNLRGGVSPALTLVNSRLAGSKFAPG